MKKNDDLKRIWEVLTGEDAKDILLFPHINPDGDAVGSCVALCSMLRKTGRNCRIVMKDIPRNLRFLDKGYSVDAWGLLKDKDYRPDVCVCVDLSDMTRLGPGRDIFLRGKTSVCIDHHVTGEHICEYSYIDPGAAASGEIIYMLFEEAGVSDRIDMEIGEALFAAVTTDTGNFQYSNTTRRTHEIAAALYDAGIDANKVSVEIYENVRLQKLRLTEAMLSTLEIFAGGKAALGYVTREMLEKFESDLSESEGFVQTLRSIEGVEIAVFLKENDNGETKVSLRAKREGDVAAVAGKYGGGGHIKAAGCTLRCSVEEARNIMMKDVSKALGIEA